MKRAFRWLLWKLCRRDFLVLRPDWTVLTRAAEHTLLGARAAKRFLPVAYNYHTAPRWQLKYRIRGNGLGTLLYRLGAPGKGHFVEFSQRAQLPLDWTVSLDDQGLQANGERLPVKPGRMIPRDTPWLVGEFDFQSDTGEAWVRRTGHRVKLGAGQSDRGYFQGAVYDDYESQASSFPRQILETIRRHRPLAGRLLDVGCATGLLVRQAQAEGLEAEGIDVSAWAVEQANARAPGRCRVLNLDTARASDFSDPYDIITLHSVIEHLADPARALDLLFALSRPGGVVYVQTLNADSLMHRLLERDWGGYTDYTHQSPWLTADWLSENSRRAGFAVLGLKRYSVWNDNVHDEVWKSFASLIQIHPAGTLLEDQFGDFVEMILQRPASSMAATARSRAGDTAEARRNRAGTVAHSLSPQRGEGRGEG